MKKILLILTIALTSNVKSYSQDYYHGFGAMGNLGFYQLDYNTPTLTYSGTSGASVPGLFYKATLGFGDLLAASAYPFLGFNLSVNSQTGSSGGIGISLPIALEFHAGDLDDACFFGGAGFNYTFLASSESGGGPIVGPEFSLGGQFNFREKLIGLRAAYTIGLNDTKLDVTGATITKDKKSLITLGIYYVLGQ